ncbi:MAG TPA: SulP family inorganic anion transporter [Burkholderiales bacterium]|nr:SulP family inorganic anion transporter [Burkholderiales bacterium]
MTPHDSAPTRRRAHHVLPFLDWLPQVNRDSLRADALAGLVGAIIVVPQGVAFATLAGLPPQFGLYAAMVPVIVAALFGSSRHLVSGPTNVISIFLLASLGALAAPQSAEYIALALTVTFLAGAMQLALGIARLGVLVNFISHTVIIGFTAAAALLILSSQLGNFLGIAVPPGTSFLGAWRHCLGHLGEINPHVVAVGIVTLAAGIATRKFFPRFPYMIPGMIAGGAFAAVLAAGFGRDATALAYVGALPAGLPPPSLPDFSPEGVSQALPIAFAVTVLALTEAVSIARAIAVKSGQRIDGNQEFIGQGLSNIAGSFFSGYASSGSFNRSGVNHESGARTPLAAVFAAVILVPLLFVVAPLMAYLPLAVLAALLFMVAYSLLDWAHMRSVVITSRQETVVMLVTIAAALLASLEFAIYAGVVLSLLLYLTRTSHPPVQDVKPDPAPGSYHFSENSGLPDCPQLKMIRVNGSIFFGAVDYVHEQLELIDDRNPSQRHVLIVASGINFIDIAGAEMLAREAARRTQMGGGLYFYRLKDAPRALLERGGYLEIIGRGNLFPVKVRAVGEIYRKLDVEICRRCAARIFRECHERLPNGEPVPG